MNANFQIKFTFSNIRFLEPIEEDWQVLLRLESDFFIFINSKILYHDIYFNVAEFAISISKWLEKINFDVEEYYFETMDAEETGLVWLKQKDDKWQIGSIYQEYEESHLFDFVEIENAVKKFLADLLSCLPKDVSKRIERMAKCNSEL